MAQIKKKDIHFLINSWIKLGDKQKAIEAVNKFGIYLNVNDVNALIKRIQKMEDKHMTKLEMAATIIEKRHPEMSSNSKSYLSSYMASHTKEDELKKLYDKAINKEDK